MILPSGDVPGAEVRSIRKNVGEAPSSILGIPRYVRAMKPINLFFICVVTHRSRGAAASRVVLCYNNAITTMR